MDARPSCRVFVSTHFEINKSLHMETPTSSSPNPKVTWSNSIGGVIIGLVLHFLVIIVFVAAVKERLGINATPSAFALVMNFYISRWYIKDKGSKKFVIGSIWLGLQVSGFLILISIITTSLVLLGLNADGGNGDGAKIIQTIPTFDSTSTIQESRVDLKYGMEAYCALPTEWKSENDSIQVTQFSLAVANYPEDQRDSMEKFANLYSRFVIDLMRDEYVFIHLSAENALAFPFDHFSLEGQTDKEYDTLANYYGCKYVVGIKKDHEATANELADSIKVHKKHKYLDSYLQSRRNAIESGIDRNYWLIFHKILMYI